MEIVITGASGFLGKNLVEYLSNLSFKVFGFGRSISHPYENPNFIYKQISWDKYDEIIKLISSRKIDFFIHLAGIQAKECEENFEKCFDFNIDKTFKLAQVCQKYKVKNFLFASTIHVYKDGDHRNILKNVAIDNSNYSNSKLIVEYLLSSLSKKEVTNFAIMRLSNIIGKLKGTYHNKNNLLFAHDICFQAISKNRIKLNSNPLTLRKFIPISFFCRQIYQLIKQENKSFSIFNFNYEVELTLYELANIVREEAKILFDKEVSIETNKKYNLLKVKFDDLKKEQNNALISDLREEIKNMLIEIDSKYIK